MKQIRIYDGQGRRYLFLSLERLKEDMERGQARIYRPDGMRIKSFQEALAFLNPKK